MTTFPKLTLFPLLLNPESYFLSPYFRGCLPFPVSSPQLLPMSLPLMGEVFLGSHLLPSFPFNPYTLGDSSISNTSMTLACVFTSNLDLSSKLLNKHSPCHLLQKFLINLQLSIQKLISLTTPHSIAHVCFTTSPLLLSYLSGCHPQFSLHSVPSSGQYHLLSNSSIHCFGLFS